MPERTRHIGLSLGADICWPICYEALFDQLDLKIDIDGETQSFNVERVAIEPFSLSQPVKYDVVIDRLTHWYHTSREWIKKAILTDDLYVYNNPWSLQSMEKHTSYCAMMRLGFPVPETWIDPAQGLRRVRRPQADARRKYARALRPATQVGRFKSVTRSS